VLLELRSQVVNQERKQAGRFFDSWYLGLRIANLIFATAWASRGAAHGRIGLRFFTSKDDGFTRCPA